MSTSIQPRGPVFTEEEVERSLTALALCSGNSVRASEMLAEDNTLQRTPDDATLRMWRTGKHAGRYQEILEERAPQIETAAVHDYRAIVARTNQVHLKLVDRTAEGIDKLDAKDASAAAKNLAIAGGVAADKLLVFTDRPNIITSHPDPMNTLASLLTNLGMPRSETPTDATVVEEPTSNPQVALVAESDNTNPREDSTESPS